MSGRTKILAAIVSVAILVGSVGAVLIANYLIPSDVTITVAPGIVALDSSDQPITVIHWGDLQQGMTKEFIIQIKNSQGTATLYLRKTESLTHNLPANIGTLTWNWQEILPSQDSVGLQPGWTFPDYPLGSGLKYSLKLKLTANSDAPQGSLSFNIVINAFDSAGG